MRFFDTQSCFPYSWEQVTRANWNKYPNDITTHVVSVDILRREIDPVTKVLRTERLIGVQQPIPRWVNKILGTDGKAYCREVSEVDLKEGTLTLRTQNLDHSHVMSVQETVTYQRDAKNPLTSTLFHQKATFHSSLSFRKLCHCIEDFSVQRFVQNSQLGRLALGQVLQNIASDSTDKLNADSMEKM